jgi:hemoglobin-like flavoprotein
MDNPREILSDSLVKQIARLRSDLEAERAWTKAHVILAEQLVDITKELKLKYYDAERRLKLKDELIRKLTNEATQ